jgi:hypothetical protein
VIRVYIGEAQIKMYVSANMCTALEPASHGVELHAVCGDFCIAAIAGNGLIFCISKKPHRNSNYFIFGGLTHGLSIL